MAVLDYSVLAILALTAYLAYCFLVVVYRVWFHPLAKFPGPKLAACSLWYEFYYDVIQEGKWAFKIRDMHERYGPIVRINPHELHIKDPEFYNDIYALGRRNKYQWFVNMAGAPGSIFATADEGLHRMRRRPLDNFFSKKAVTDLEPLISEKVQKLSDRFSQAADNKDIVRADCAFMALTMDVICSYCFAADRRYLDNPDFGLEWKETINGAWQKGGMIRAFPFMPFFMRRFPRWLAKKLDPDMSLFLAWQDSVEDTVRPILNGESEKNQHSIFHTLRDSDIPPQEKTLRRLSDEGEIFTGAGSETTAKASTTILYYLITYPECLAKLKEELRNAMPDPSILVSWTQLEQLPYLSAVIQEGIRLTGGITTRLPRVANEPLRYEDWIIPAGTPVSETINFILMDPVIFPEPLAYAEMYLACAALVRRFNFELYKTDSRNMEMVHDFFVAAPAKDFRSVRVRISRDEQ
ncbi:hypothetical protein PRZ48_011799 [Zasmidium cellare]|uniref:Cytochrome P450 n=1 Tax=Zasmidium cellare TaxID=395010 RepID=A0ABR0E7V5_ZASCE|nr:hypothetical protein PRZ48_011799 [Zasmidium cellare]